MSGYVIGNRRVIRYQRARNGRQLLVLRIGVGQRIGAFQLNANRKIIAALATTVTGNASVPRAFIERNILNDFTVTANQTMCGNTKMRNATEVNLCSVEDPVEIPLDGINQTQIHPRAGLTFQGVLRALLRQDPDVIMIGEIRDGETAEIAIKAAQTGHLVLSTLHTNSSCEALIRLQQMGVARWMLSSALNLVAAQRLVRKLCPHCRRLTNDPIRLPQTLCPTALPRWQAVGCEHCYHGFYGRTALFEVLPVTAELRQHIASGAPVEALEGYARQAGMLTLFESGCRAVDQGLTTFEELVRILGMPNEQ